jgi:hypothetical protein
VTVAVPGRPAATGTGTVSVPGETETDAGTDAIAGSLLVSAIVVTIVCGALIVAVSVPVLPWVSDKFAGSRARMVGTGQRLELGEAAAVRTVPSSPFSIQTRLLSLKRTGKAPWTGVRPGWKTVVWPRSWGEGVNLFFGPTGIVTGTVLALLYP